MPPPTRLPKADGPALDHAVPQDGLARPPWVVQARTAVSSRLCKGATDPVNLLRRAPTAAQAGCCRIAQWDDASGSQAHVCARVSEVQPASA